MNSTSSIKTSQWLVRRELWEHRSFWIVPLVVMSIILIANLVAVIKGSSLQIAGPSFSIQHGFSDTLVPMIREVILAVMVAIFGVAAGIVSIFYLLDCLYSERRDRSVLFWKSLPISDAQTVGSKLFTGIVVLPVIALIAAVITYIAIVLLLSLSFGFRDGYPVAGFWSPVFLLSSALKWLIYTMSQQIWFLPVYAWLLFCSAFTRKAPFLVATLVPLAIILAERLAYSRSFFMETVGNYFIGFFAAAENSAPHLNIDSTDFGTGEASVDFGALGFLNYSQLLSQPQFYVGIAVAAALIYASIWWRRHNVELG
ncbi:MAG: hypothetical protein AAF465_12090 [Pseudomonadota bacterium]